MKHNGKKTKIEMNCTESKESMNTRWRKSDSPHLRTEMERERWAEEALERSSPMHEKVLSIAQS